MKLSVVIPVMNQHPMFRAMFKQLVDASGPDVEFVVIDNGSDEILSKEGPFIFGQLKVGQSIHFVRNYKSIGVYPTFQQGMKSTSGDIVAFFHSDLIVWEKEWDKRVIQQFELTPPLGLLGFIGSNEIDSNGGRGGGTTSQFMGKTLVDDFLKNDESGIHTHDFQSHSWSGSPASAHGKTNSGYTRGAVVDGCAMILRRSAWDAIGVKADFPLHHFYDRLISCQMLEKGYHVGILGIACDHISGQTVNQEPAYDGIAREWCEAHGLGMEGHNWDTTIYLEAERRFLREYRDEKAVLPVKF